jgi:hypothetical protein
MAATFPYRMAWEIGQPSAAFSDMGGFSVDDVRAAGVPGC